MDFFSAAVDGAPYADNRIVDDAIESSREAVQQSRPPAVDIDRDLLVPV